MQFVLFWGLSGGNVYWICFRCQLGLFGNNRTRCSAKICFIFGAFLAGHVYWICFRCQLGLFGGGRSGRTHLHCTVLGLAAISYVGRLLSLLFVEIYFILGPSLGTQPELVSGAIHIHLIHKWPPTFIHSFIFSKILAISAILNSRWNKGYCIVLYCIITWDERATKHGIEAFWDKNLFSCKLWPSNWPTYVEIIAHLKAISLMRQFPDC